MEEKSNKDNANYAKSLNSINGIVIKKLITFYNLFGIHFLFEIKHKVAMIV